MVGEFQQYVAKHGLIDKGSRVLVALSGGVDSMVLAELLRRSGYDIAFAHCNFHLRGDESDGDERFVREYADRVGVELLVKHFDTVKYAEENKISIEMAARELRYSWFKEIVVQSENSHEQNSIPFSKVAIAHHSDDQIETFFINLLRGSGIRGLKAMQPINGLYIRPLLWASREEIKQFALDNGIQWREDRTNQDTVYFRNKIRHELLPILDGMKSDAREKIRISVECLASENQLYRDFIKEKLANIEKVEGVLHSISKTEFKDNLQLLFEWARDFGFTYSQCETIMSVLNSESGKEFYSNDYQLVVEKNTIEIFPISIVAIGAQRSGATSNDKPSSASRRDAISITQDKRSEAIAIRISRYDKSPYFKLVRSNPFLAQLDADKLNFPLNIRHWQQGDRFRPLGMHGSKLVSDFFNDLNFTAFQKKTTLIITDADDNVVWIAGHRIDDRYKITDKTTTICEIILD